MISANSTTEATPVKSSIRVLSAHDLPAIMKIELDCYEFPWTEAIFRDCFRAGHVGLALFDFDDKSRVSGTADKSRVSGTADTSRVSGTTDTSRVSGTADTSRVSGTTDTSRVSGTADTSLIGYGVLSVAAGEAHVLNVAVRKDLQGQGLGKKLMQRLLDQARWYRAERVFLEVRRSNISALELYRRIGFNEIGERSGYYPAKKGREDAIVMALELFAAPAPD